MKRKQRCTVMLGTVMLALLGAVGAGAQSDNGKIAGSVADNTGAFVSGAKIVATNQSTGVTHEDTADASGIYTFPSLPAGTYTLTTSMTGFESSKQTGIVLDAASTRTVNFKLVVGQVSQEVVVEATSQQQVDTTDGEVASTINGKQIENIALNGRNYLQLLRLVPGTVSTTLDPFALLLSTTGQNVNGVRGASILMSVDGITVMDAGANISVFATPSPDTISETRVLAASFSAENPSPYGGASINVITKSGTRSLHGDVYEFVRNDLFDAKSDFAITKLPLHFNDYGFTLGGPIFIPGRFNKDRSKLFFFVGEEWKAIHTGVNSTGTVPTVGAFGQINGIFTTPVYQPGTKTLYPAGSCTQNTAVLNNAATGYCVPQSAWSANGPRLLKAYPQPNLTGTSNISINGVNQLNNHEQRYNVDYDITAKDLLSVRFTHNSNNQVSAGSLNIVPYTLFPRPGFIYSINYTRTFSSNLVNNLAIGETHNRYTSMPNDVNLALSTLGLTYTQPFPTNIFNSGPSVSITGFTSISPGTKDTKEVQNLILNDDLSWVRGRHTLKFGFFMQRAKIDEWNLTPGNTQGSVSFTTSTALTTGNALADVFTGNFNQYNQSSSAGYYSSRFLQTEGYAQDNWRANSHLSVEYGLRYSFPQNAYSPFNAETVFQPSLYSAANAPTVNANGTLSGTYNPYNGLALVGTGFAGNASKVFPTLVNNPAVLALFGNIPRGFAATPKTNFAPRVGVAFTPFASGKTSIRAGYGIFFSRPSHYLQQFPSFDLPFNSNVSILNGNIDNPVGSPGSVFPSSLYTLPQTFKSAYIQTRNLGVQQQLPGRLILEVGYVGNQGLHLAHPVNINQLPVGTISSNSVNAGKNANLFRTYKGYADIDQEAYDDVTNYNSLQTTIGRRVGKGLNFSGSFTLSKTMEGTSDPLSVTLPENSYNVKADYSVADINRSKVVSVNGVYDLPFFAAGNRLERNALGGWTLSGVFSFQTGAPTNIILGSDVAGESTSQYGSPIGGMTQRASVVPGQNPNKASQINVNTTNCQAAGVRRICSWFNTAAFTSPAPGTLGNASRNIVIGPWYTQTDMSLYKHFHFGDQREFELRGETFNVFNHGSYTTIGNTYGTATFGTVTAATPGRLFQFAAKLQF